MLLYIQSLLVLLTFSLTHASPLLRQASNPYAPIPGSCPSTPLVRAATGVSTAEANYVRSRYAVASTALYDFVKSSGTQLGITFKPPTTGLPLLALTVSGGGLRSLLTGAGVIQGFDSRESHTRFDAAASGIFQAVTYQTGLGGGGWLLSSLAGNNYPTVSSLTAGLWQNAFNNTLLVPGGPSAAPAAYKAIAADIAAKSHAGFAPTLTDPYGRLLAYQLLYGPDGGVQDTLSGLTSLSNFTSYLAPYPILTALGVENTNGQCLPPANAPQYELHPYEFGSWDSGIAAFTPTHYLGTRLTNGATNGTCYTRYDNLGYVAGTTANIFNELCTAIPRLKTNINTTSPTTASTTFTSSALAPNLAALVSEVHAVANREEYAVYPNPFFASSHSPLVSSESELTLIDGGESNQNNPLWPLLHRPLVDVVIVNDNSADLPTNYPNGSQLYNTYLQAQAAGLTRMPPIPTPDIFVAQGYNINPIFFGCDNNDTLTIIYLPNRGFGGFNSGLPTDQLQYNATETAAMIANGFFVSDRAGDPNWGVCLACGIMKKAPGTLPPQCIGCYQEYCYGYTVP